MQQTRHVPLAGASNFRDFGGYATEGGRAVKWRRLYRSDRLSELTAADHARLAPLGIRHVYDLRRQSEADAAPTHWPGEAAPRLIRHPIFEDEAGGPSTFERIAVSEEARHDPALARAIMGQLYARIVTEPGPLAALPVMVEHLAEPDACPVLIHCSAGKDRTGVAAALLLGLLGVADDVIATDYAQSSLAMAELIAWVRTNHPESATTMSDQPKTFLECPAEAMAGFLDQLTAKFGSIQGYAEAIGISAATRRRLRDAFTA
jgi:protein tyrosine/serine phosphatase